jgi:type I restriction enzyme M protein
VQDILEKFAFCGERVDELSKADAIGTLIEKFLSPEINPSPNPVLNHDGSVKHPGLDKHGMGTIVEELVCRFNEENNEEAGEHWTPRDAVRLMAKLMFLPVADRIESGTYLLYDGARGTGGMLTVAEETLRELAEQHGKSVAAHLYGRNPKLKVGICGEHVGDPTPSPSSGASAPTTSAPRFRVPVARLAAAQAELGRRVFDGLARTR